MSGSRAVTASARDSWPSSSASHDSKQSVVCWIPSSSFVGGGRCKKVGLFSRSTMRAMRPFQGEGLRGNQEKMTVLIHSGRSMASCFLVEWKRKVQGLP